MRLQSFGANKYIGLGYSRAVTLQLQLLRASYFSPVVVRQPDVRQPLFMEMEQTKAGFAGCQFATLRNARPLSRPVKSGSERVDHSRNAAVL